MLSVKELGGSLLSIVYKKENTESLENTYLYSMKAFELALLDYLVLLEACDDLNGVVKLGLNLFPGDNSKESGNLIAFIYDIHKAIN